MLKVGDRVKYLGCCFEDDKDYNDLYFTVGHIYTVEKVYKSGSCAVKANGELVMLIPFEFEVVNNEILDIEDCL